MSGEDTCILAAIQSVVMLGVEVDCGHTEAGAGRGRNRCSVPPILLSVSSHLTTIYDVMHLCHTLTLKTNLKLLSQNNKNFRNNMNFMYNTYSIVLVL